MDAATLVREGKPQEALAALEQEVRSQPAESKHRLFLFQLLSILGDWDRAATQLQVAAELDASMLVLANVYRSAIRTELLREEVFAARRSPLILGEPGPWIGDLLESLRMLAEGEHNQALELRDRALENAPVVGGALTVGDADPVPFEWLADCDSRLGPVAELILEGRYYWVPLSRIATISFQAPTDLRDLVWLPCDVVWTNGGDASALMPARYPGADASSDPALLMSRATQWAEPKEGYLVGDGTRVLVTDSNEAAILDVRAIRFDHPEEPQVDGS